MIKMVKKMTTILCAFTLLFSSVVKADSTYNNEEKVTEISNIPENELFTFPGSYYNGDWISFRNRDEITQKMGVSPYWRIGKEHDIEYGIYKTDATHYLILTTNIYDTFVDRWYVSKIPSKSLFEKYVKIGTNMKVVKLIDPDCKDMLSGNDYTYTYHRFNDGTCASIDYIKNNKGEFVVCEISNYKDQFLVVNNLLDIDYELIKNENPNEEKELIKKLKSLNLMPEYNNNIIVVEKKPSRVKIRYAKRVNKKFIKIKFKKAKNAKKYQIQYASNKRFKKAKIKTTKKSYFTIKAKNKKAYYIRVRGVNSKKKGIWSKIKRVKRIKK